MKILECVVKCVIIGCGGEWGYVVYKGLITKELF